jgi:hypothetical protein
MHRTKRLSRSRSPNFLRRGDRQGHAMYGYIRIICIYKLTVTNTVPTKQAKLFSEGGKMIDTQDEIDKALIARVKTTQCTSIRDVIRPFLLEKSESVLRTRIRYLELHKLIRTTKTTHGRIKCFPVD